MKITPLKTFLLLGFIFLTSQFSFAQNLSPQYQFEILDKKSGDRMDLEEWIQEGLSAIRENPCEPTFGYFIFKVKGSGEIDSLQYFGTLEKSVSEHVLKRIRISQSGWIPKRGKPKSGYQWFLYPFFDFGKERYTTSNCSPEDKAKQKLLIEVAEKLGTVWLFTMAKNISLINISRNGGGYLKL